MKQGTCFVLPVEFSCDLAPVESIDFIFVQENIRLLFTYPSFRARRDGETNVIDLLWTAEETYLFRSGRPMQMDTLIRFRGAETNPETPIIRLVMQPTLFRQEEITHDSSDSESR